MSQESIEITAEDLHSYPSSGTFKPQKVIQILSPYGLNLVFIYLSS